jgi:transcriptional regulator with XRE-family HTH domain
MLNHDELLQHPNYLLQRYQLEIFRQLSDYMKANNLKKQDVAEKLNVSRSYISQILNGDFNFTLKKLIELGLMMNKVPFIEFIQPKEYWRREREGTTEYVVKEVKYTVEAAGIIDASAADYNLLDQTGGRLPTSVSTTLTQIVA